MAARWLAASTQFTAPVSSYFVNPGGDALVALREGGNRSGRSCAVEMAYYALLLADEQYHTHLATAGKVQIRSCRDVSVTIPQSRMAMFAGLAAKDVQLTHGILDLRVSIWSINSAREMTARHQRLQQFSEVTLDDWIVKVAPEVASFIRTARGAGEVETGGVLLGGFDLERRTLFVTSALPNSPESKTGRTYF